MAMMQIGGVDNLVLKDIKLPVEEKQEEVKTRPGEEESAARSEEAAQKTAEDEKRAEETERSVYGDVVGKSSDGDTTRVRKDAMEALEEGMVFTKEEKENNLMEFNRDQLKVMVEKSDISENRYDHEITRRDDIMEKDEESAFAKSNAEMIEKQKEETEKKAREEAKERLDEMQGKGEKPNAPEEENSDKAEEENKAVSNTENENTQRLENGMNVLAGAVKGLEIEEEGVLNAAENGRSDVIDQILNPEDGNLKVIIR